MYKYFVILSLLCIVSFAGAKEPCKNLSLHFRLIEENAQSESSVLLKGDTLITNFRPPVRIMAELSFTNEGANECAISKFISPFFDYFYSATSYPSHCYFFAIKKDSHPVNIPSHIIDYLPIEELALMDGTYDSTIALIKSHETYKTTVDFDYCMEFLTPGIYKVRAWYMRSFAYYDIMIKSENVFYIKVLGTK